MTSSINSAKQQPAGSIWQGLAGIIDRPRVTFQSMLQREDWQRWALPLLLYLVAFAVLTAVQTPYLRELALQQADLHLVREGGRQPRLEEPVGRPRARRLRLRRRLVREETERHASERARLDAVIRVREHVEQRRERRMVSVVQDLPENHVAPRGQHEKRLKDLPAPVTGEPPCRLLQRADHAAPGLLVVAPVNVATRAGQLRIQQLGELQEKDVDARYNYWGTGRREQIEERLYDRGDVSYLGRVLYDPPEERPFPLDEAWSAAGRRPGRERETGRPDPGRERGKRRLEYDERER